ncbi:major facilitator super transporter protein [Haplosporangium gracile]|nr:major facilitator super transporter protein [Haplosporangium gracile]
MRPWILYGILLPSLACQFVGLVMFAKGFFPYKAISTTFASLEDMPLEPSLAFNGESALQTTVVKPRFGKIVLMLVDALRSDFLYGNESDFRLMQSLIDEHKAIPFTALASAPTVTLPRLKALTTGTVPGFLDAILNIAESDQSSTLANQDNWIAQLTRSASLRKNAKRTPGQEEKRKVAFFGDDTWIKLFPGLFFRSEGTSSFFAMDTIEVDNNVTRHIEPELEKDDWDGLIFHYLGLDHVGHSGGPKSGLMRPKQAEMDSVAHTIYTTLVKKESLTEIKKDELPTLFVLCGDHGMNEVGNHGGSSRSEISTSFLFMSPSFEGKKARQQIRNMVDPYRTALDREDYEYYRSVGQADLVPTLSLLMGLPIPKNSVGQLIPELFLDLTELEILRMFQVNAYQVAGVLRNMWSDFEVESSVLLKNFKDPGVDTDSALEADEVAHQKCKSLKSEKQRLGCWYTLALAEHASFLEMHPSRATGFVVYGEQERAQKLKAAEKAYSKFLSDATSMLSTALSKYDMSLLTNGSLFMAFAVAGMIFAALQTRLIDDFKLSCREPRHVVSAFSSTPYRSSKKRSSMTTLISAAFSTTITDRTESRTKATKRDRNEINWTMARVLSAVTLVLYLITLFASSFVEEEHQFWYFFNMTWWMVLGLISARYLPSGTSSSQLSSFAGAGYCFLQMAILRLLRSWNQTGQKYADQIDLRHYLNSTRVAFSWATFAVTIIGLGASVVFVVFSQRPARSGTQSSSQHTTPAWKSALVPVLQSLITVNATLTLLWITVYKMDLEAVHFGSELMARVHNVMSTISSVGYSIVPSSEQALGAQELVYSGYAMARGCYAGMGAILLLTLVLRLVTVSTRPTSSEDSQAPTRQAEKSLSSKIMEDRDRTLFMPWMTLGVVTMLMILLSRRHNAVIYVFFGIQLYAYLNWTSLVRQRSELSDNQKIMEDVLELDYMVEEATNNTMESKTFNGRQHPLKSTGQIARVFRTAPGLNSIHSCSILLWTLSSFFLLGNSNSIASIDISNAYVGIQSYDIFFTGVLTFVSNWAGPLWWTIAALVLIRWDLEWEVAWAKENRELALQEKEERGWKTVQGWRRSEKGTLNKRTMRRIWKYKKATGAAVNKDVEVGSKKEVEAEIAAQGADQLEKAQASLDVDVADAPHIDGQVQNVLPSQKGEEEEEEEEEDGAFFIEEEQSLENGQDSARGREVIQEPCVLQESTLFKRRLSYTRMVEHLIVTSVFFGITLYALSIAAIILRHHLFIWTVFSPKVLYQFAWTVLFQTVVQVVVVGGGIWSLIVMT